MPRITRENIIQYFRDGESDTIEFKRTVPPRLETIERIISAFANTKGGSIIFGYDEQENKVIGISQLQVEQLENGVEKFKSGIQYSIYPVEVDDKIVAVLDVEKSHTATYFNGVAYIRKGDRIYSKVGLIRSKYLKEFIDEIQYRNRNPRETRALKSLGEKLTNPVRVLPPDTQLYRCRIINDTAEVGKEPGFFGYGKKASFVPPPKSTRDMRANYRYIPYLYCANNPYTALVEVRPRLGTDVSIATIHTTKELVLLDFTLKTTPPGMTPAKQNLFADLSMLYSKPVTSEDEILDYIPTQYIAEYAKHLGYDGIAFRSSLTPELEEQDVIEHEELDRYNVVVFNYDKCVVSGSNVVNVTRNYIKCEQIDDAPSRIDVHTTILDMHY